MAGYTGEEVERVILALYAGQNVAEANSWLTLFVTSPAAWEISVTMISSSPHMQVRFFAANALHQKISKGDVQELPPDAQMQLLGSILGAMQSDERSQQEILTKLSLALVALGLFFCKDEGRLKAALLDNPAFLALRPRAALEFFLLLPQEWEKLTLTRAKEQLALQQLALLLPQVVSLIQSLLSSAENQEMLLRSLQALAGWCKFGISLSNLRTLPFYNSVIELTRSPTLCKGACELLEAAIKCTSYPPESDELLLEVVQNVVALQPLFAEAKAQRNDDFCEGLTMVARALVQRNGNLMCSGQGSTLQLAQLTLEMVGHPNKGISELAMEFWDELEIVDMDKRHESLRAPIFQVLLEVLASRCAPYPPGFVDWDSCEDDGEEEFHMFRRRIEEALLSCCVVLRSDSLAVLCGMLSAAGDRWEAVEATLFSIGCIGFELMTQDEAAQRQQVLARVSELFTGYIFREGAIPASPGSCAHVAALKIIQSYGRCLPQNPSLVTPALQFIVGRLADQNTAAAAAKAFEAVCAQASHPSVGHLMRDPSVVQAMLQQVMAHMPSMDRAVVHSVVESFGRLLSNVQREHMLSILELLITPFLSRIRELVGGDPGGFVQASTIAETAGNISMVGAAVRFLESEGGVEGGADSQHPVVLVMQLCWEALDASIAKFPGDPTIAEALCEVYLAALKQAKGAAQGLLGPLFTSLVAIYRGTRCEKCLEVAGAAVEYFGQQESAVGTFQMLLQELNTISFEAAQAQGLEAVPDMLVQLFSMLIRYLIYCPHAISTSPSLPTVFELAKAGVVLRNKGPLQQIISFLQQLVNVKDQALFDAHIGPLFAANGQSLTESLVTALADTAPDVMRLPHLMYTLNARFGPAYQAWLRHAVTTGSFNDNVDDALKESFLRANVNVEHNRGRFQALVQDFANICRSRESVDALLAYQLA